MHNFQWEPLVIDVEDFNNIVIVFRYGLDARDLYLCLEMLTVPAVETKQHLAYLINLERRSDRWSDFCAVSTNLKFNVERFSAIDGKNLSHDELRLPAPVAACWSSHQEIAKILLGTSSSHCLVLEDDVKLSTEGIDSLNQIMDSDLTGIDLLQVGFCVHNNKLADRTKYRLQVNLVKGLHLTNNLKTGFIRKILRRVYGTEFVMLNPISLLAAKDSFELGTHAYIFSRKFALALTEFNSPAYLHADLALIELAQTGKFASFRLLANLLSQSDSPSSIQNASRNPLESEIASLAQTNVN